MIIANQGLYINLTKTEINGAEERSALSTMLDGTKKYGCLVLICTLENVLIVANIGLGIFNKMLELLLSYIRSNFRRFRQS